nr:MAG TPA: hypothetical protein [Caudoviricetes sp.]
MPRLPPPFGKFSRAYSPNSSRATQSRVRAASSASGNSPR